MKLSLVGYGKMGHAVEKIARERGHEIVCVIDAGESDKFQSPEFLGSDAVIEFTTPATAVDNYLRVIEAGIPLVSGTTAWHVRLPEVEAALADSPQGMFWTSNFSIGVNLFQKLVEQAVRLIGPYPQYRPEMTEIHHIHKLDHPSGTAVTTAERIIAASRPKETPASPRPGEAPAVTRPGDAQEAPRPEDTTAASRPDDCAPSEARSLALSHWTENPAEAAADPTALLINHKREGEVPGTHIVTWTSPVDAITVEHRAFSREGFALGAVIAAEWMVANHPRGLRSMSDLMN